MNEEMLHPNCSEVCWRLDLTCTLPVKEQICEALEKTEVDEDDYDIYGQDDELINVFNGMLSNLQELKARKLPYQKVELEFSDDGGGGGDYSAVEDCFHYAMEVCNCKMTRTKALKLLEADEDNIVNNGF